jgi:hypothetical protein
MVAIRDWERCTLRGPLAEPCERLAGHDGAHTWANNSLGRRFEGVHAGCAIAMPHIHPTPYMRPVEPVDEERAAGEHQPQSTQEHVNYEAVHHPAHYNQGDIEHVEYVEDRGWSVGYCLGNATKYIHRAGNKPGNDSLQDLKKARWYLDRYISWLEQGKAIWKIKKCEEKTGSPDAAGS